MSFNDDELVAPAWLNDEFFRDAMREANKDPTIELTSGCVLRPGTNKGDHLASVMFRTTVSYRSKRYAEEQSINLIIKTKPEVEGIKKEILQENPLFDIEIRMYSKILPEIARLMKEIGEEYKYPRYIHGALQPQTVFMLEDIRPQGWQMDDYVKTMDDMQLVVKNIAMFHAGSVVMQRNDPSIAAEFNFSPEKMYKSFEAMINKSFADLMLLTQKYPEFAHFAKPLENFIQNLPEIYCSVFKPSKTVQNVLIHGDFHSKNMLHQIDKKDGRHTETILLDYQMCSWTTPAVDLYYLLDLIPTQEVKDNHRQELIYMYYQHYSGYLKRLGFLGKIPTLLDLHIELLRCSGLELVHHAVFTSYRYQDPTTVDMEALMLGKIENPVLSNPEFKKLMHTELSRFLHQGTLISGQAPN